MQAATLAEAAPGRFALGIGASSPVVVGDWNARAVRASRSSAAATSCASCARRWPASWSTSAFDTFTVRRFRWSARPRCRRRSCWPRLRGRMLRLAAAEADGAILNWLSADDVPTARGRAGGGAGRASRSRRASSSARPTTPTYARAIARRLIAGYLTVPAYAAFHRWLGRGEMLKPMWDAWAAGDRKARCAAIPDEVVDALIVHGTPERVPRPGAPLRRRRRDDLR